MLFVVFINLILIATTVDYYARNPGSSHEDVMLIFVFMFLCVLTFAYYYMFRNARRLVQETKEKSRMNSRYY